LHQVVVRLVHGVAAQLAVRQALAVEAGAAVFRRAGGEVEHAGVAAQAARVGMRARAGLLLADDLHAVVVERLAFRGGLHPQFLRPGGLPDLVFQRRQFAWLQRRDRAPARPAFPGVREAQRPVLLGQAALAHLARIRQRVVEQPVVAALGGLAVGQHAQRREACIHCPDYTAAPGGLLNFAPSNRRSHACAAGSSPGTGSCMAAATSPPRWWAGSFPSRCRPGSSWWCCRRCPTWATWSRISSARRWRSARRTSAATSRAPIPARSRPGCWWTWARSTGWSAIPSAASTTPRAASWWR